VRGEFNDDADDKGACAERVDAAACERNLESSACRAASRSIGSRTGAGAKEGMAA